MEYGKQQPLQQLQARFALACQQVQQRQQGSQGIGTLQEKMLHGAIKYTLEPNDTYHEVPINGFVADVVAENSIWEVQTGSFTGLAKKLPHFLQQGKVTVIYPVARQKWLSWLDDETGEVTGRRKSPKTGNPWEIFYELGRIKPFLKHPNLYFQIWLIDMEEYRRLNGWSKDKKKGATRYERRPLALGEVVSFHTPAEYLQLIPGGLPCPFTRKDFAKRAKASSVLTYRALNILEHMGVVSCIGKKGRSFLYEISVQPMKETGAALQENVPLP